MFPTVLPTLSQQFWLAVYASVLCFATTVSGVYILKFLIAKRLFLLCTNSSSFSQVISFTHTWTIDNVRTLFAENTANRSPVFHSAPFGPTDNDPVQFSLELYLRGFSGEYDDYVSIYLNLDDSDKEEVEAFFYISILDADGEKMLTHGDPITSRFCIDNLGWGFNNFIRRAALLEPSNGYLANNSLTIHCEISMLVTFSKSARQTPIEVSADFSELLESDKYSDVSLVVGQKHIPAHKVILATRSPVFRDMFRFDMKESIENRVEITETELELFRQLLAFIYTGKVPSIDQFAAKLLPLADKFQVDLLKTACEKHLTSKLSTESVIDTLRFAERHSAELLMEEAVYFIRRQISYHIQATTDSDLLEKLFNELVLQNEGNLLL